MVNHSQKHSLYFSPRFCEFDSNTASDWLILGLANQRLCYCQMFLNTERIGEQDKEQFQRGRRRARHSQHQYFLLVQHAALIKSEDKILRKCLKKKDEIFA